MTTAPTKRFGPMPAVKSNRLMEPRFARTLALALQIVRWGGCLAIRRRLQVATEVGAFHVTCSGGVPVRARPPR